MKHLSFIVLIVVSFNLSGQKGTITNDTIQIKYKAHLNLRGNTFTIKIKKQNLSKDTMITFGYYKYKFKHAFRYAFYFMQGRLGKNIEYFYNSTDTAITQLHNFQCGERLSGGTSSRALPPNKIHSYRIKIVLLSIPKKLYFNERYFLVKNTFGLGFLDEKKAINMRFIAKEHFDKSSLIMIPLKIPKRIKKNTKYRIG